MVNGMCQEELSPQSDECIALFSNYRCTPEVTNKGSQLERARWLDRNLYGPIIARQFENVINVTAMFIYQLATYHLKLIEWSFVIVSRNLLMLEGSGHAKVVTKTTSYINKNPHDILAHQFCSDEKIPCESIEYWTGKLLEASRAIICSSVKPKIPIFRYVR